MRTRRSTHTVMTHRHGSRVSRSDGLPRRIDFDDGSHIDYAYSADGEKLRVDYYLNPYTPAVPDGEEFGIACDSSQLVHTWREYAGNRVYENGVLSRLLFDGGYVSFGDSGEPTYHYYIKDYLGNNRIVADAHGNVEEVNHYYPYGALMGDSRNATTHPYKYIGKELDRTHGLDWNDHGARHYDPITGRWNTMDKMCEKYYDVSPYASCGDDPVNAVDPDGKQVRPQGKEEIAMILSTLQEEYRNFVSIGKNGVIDANRLNEYKGNDYNAQMLKELVANPVIIEIFLSKSFSWKIGSAYTDNPDDKDLPNPYPMNLGEKMKDPAPKEYVDDITTEDTGLWGKTLFPDNDGVQNSTSNNVEVYINLGLSPNGRAEAYSHEVNGHVLLYLRSGYNHKMASHLYIGARDTNTTLRNLIMKSKIETIKNNR